MKLSLPTLVAVLLLTACAPQSQVPAKSAPVTAPLFAEVEADDLLGDWTLALYYSPDSPPSSTSMKITSVNGDGTLEGSFYETPFETARYTLRGGDVIITLLTSDNSGPYYTSGRLQPGGKFEGQTLSTGRGFLMPWTATLRE